MGCLEEIRRSCDFVYQNAEHVRVVDSALHCVADDFEESRLNSLSSAEAFDAEIHLTGKGALTAQYLLVVDALNFCFWPEKSLEYKHLAKGLKESVQRDQHCISAENLSKIDVDGVVSLVGRRLPLLPERARLLREVGRVLLQSYSGQASSLIECAESSAELLVGLLTTQFRGFQDHAIYRGQQVFLYKRAQIFVGDVWGAFQGQGLGTFHDIHRLTMFADYRVPVVLRQLGILEYRADLAEKVQREQQLGAGSCEEVEIRACSIVAVEKLAQRLAHRFGRPVLSLQLDWFLWEMGEQHRGEDPPHHRTLTIFY